MGNIVLARIDDRLIHGQVMTAWVQHTGGNEIVIADDKVAKDPFLCAVITGAVPKHLKAQAMTLKDAAAYLKEKEDEQERKFIILTKGPDAYLELIQSGVNIQEINLGGMGSRQGRTKLYKNISAGQDERDMFQELTEKNVHIYIQVVPNTEKVELNKVL
ncbi:MAG TPA: PTS sugar transporter subunit IIB [Candidatus Anaerostipes excrementavium]|uniref:PTS sugar transporter subunit IIB n=1 Tax=Candidatus Anaerostipes excrementavium TaxID=2838463 RepID=A0A9D1WUQ8_9FIRM|nr:PTS sugar transporter subunit IIB [uncultured Anaerostipes sp.]HIX67569.1 PTS sugar transporter subunit IIB [Candidatus Anaerostipes excrementavium]